MEFDKAYTSYNSGSLGFKEYLANILHTVGQVSIDLSGYEHINKLAEALKGEDAINFRKANIERDVLISRLQKRLSEKELEELVLKTIEIKTEDITENIFYSYLLNKTYQVGIDTTDYPQLGRYAAYIKLYDSVDSELLMEELKLAEQKIKEYYFEDDEQRRIDRLSSDCTIIGKLFKAQLSHEEYIYYSENKDTFRFESFLGDSDMAELREYMDQMIEFYGYSFDRDNEFLSNMKYSDNKAIIVTGGFHSENLCDLFKQNKIGYISIRPEFDNREGYECPYFDLLSGVSTPVERNNK